MIQHSILTTYSGLDLRGLWPVISTTLLPETQKRIRNAIEDISDAIVREECAHDKEVLVAYLLKLEHLMLDQWRKLEIVIADRLLATAEARPNFTADHFQEACTLLSVLGAEIKTEWTRIHDVARRCFGRARNSPHDKLSLARLNAVEQDILYVLFVEQQYVIPNILKQTGTL